MIRFLTVFSLIGCMFACGDVSVGENAVISPDVNVAPKSTPAPAPAPKNETKTEQTKTDQTSTLETEASVIEPVLEQVEEVPEWPKRLRMDIVFDNDLKLWTNVWEYNCEAILEMDELTFERSISYTGTCGGYEIDFSLKYFTHSGQIRTSEALYFGVETDNTNGLESWDYNRLAIGSFDDKIFRSYHFCLADLGCKL